ncbi:MAG: hypothetical protein ACKO6L_03200 [Flavobacteriales bacterium]
MSWILRCGEMMMRLFAALLGFWIATVVLGSCTEPTTKHANTQEEGRVIYEVTFPDEPETITKELYPSEMTVYFKHGKMRSEVRSGLNLLVTNIIVNHDAHTLTQMLKNISRKHAMVLDESQTRAWLNKFPMFKYEHTAEVDTLAGMPCAISIAYPSDTTQKPIRLYHTRGIPLQGTNWWNPYRGINGFLLGYEVNQYGMRMVMRAKEIFFEPVDDQVFSVPAEYKMVQSAQMDSLMQEIVHDFMQ